MDTARVERIKEVKKRYVFTLFALLICSIAGNALAAWVTQLPQPWSIGLSLVVIAGFVLTYLPVLALSLALAWYAFRLSRELGAGTLQASVLGALSLLPVLMWIAALYLLRRYRTVTGVGYDFFLGDVDAPVSKEAAAPGGERLPGGRVKCPGCGQVLERDGDTNFCDDCGEPLAPVE